MSADFDLSGLDSFVASIDRTVAVAPRNVRAAVEVTARHVKDDSRVNAAKHGAHGARLGAAVSYEIKSDADGTEAKVGPSSSGPGRLVNMIEGSWPGTGGVPFLRDPAGALKKNEADFVRGIEQAITDSLT